jgi:hypothetical protein
MSTIKKSASVLVLGLGLIAPTTTPIMQTTAQAAVAPIATASAAAAVPVGPTGCHGQRARRVMTKSAVVDPWYWTIPPQRANATVKLTFRQIYDDCPNGRYPRKGMPMAYEACYNVLDYNRNGPEFTVRRLFHVQFQGVTFDHVVKQTATNKRTDPPARTVSDGGRQNCLLVQETIDDRIWFRFFSGNVTTAWTAWLKYIGRRDPDYSRARWWRPNEDRRIPLAGRVVVQ